MDSLQDRDAWSVVCGICKSVPTANFPIPCCEISAAWSELEYKDDCIATNSTWGAHNYDARHNIFYFWCRASYKRKKEHRVVACKHAHTHFEGFHLNLSIPCSSKLFTRCITERRGWSAKENMLVITLTYIYMHIHTYVWNTSALMHQCLSLESRHWTCQWKCLCVFLGWLQHYVCILHLAKTRTELE